MMNGSAVGELNSNMAILRTLLSELVLNMSTINPPILNEPIYR